MLTKRIVPCLDIANGRTVKGVNFDNLRDAGDPVELARFYLEQGADELAFLDIKATLESRSTTCLLVERVAAEISIPFLVGGGIRTVEDARVVLRAGADKVAINSAAFVSPILVSELAEEFGSQAIVVAIDYYLEKGQRFVAIKAASETTPVALEEWAERAQNLGAGELLLTSISADGTKQGFDLEGIAQLSKNLRLPIIASGGAGELKHFADVFEVGADAALAASVFHFGEIEIPALKRYLRELEIPVRV